jgi:hypothetical protein
VKLLICYFINLSLLFLGPYSLFNELASYERDIVLTMDKVRKPNISVTLFVFKMLFKTTFCTKDCITRFGL